MAEIKIFITGDYCPIGRNASAIDDGDYSMIEEIIPFSSNSDLSITNLEAPITDATTPIIKAGPNIKAKTNALKPLTFAGFNLVTLANNHILDFSEIGVKDTIEHCEKNAISYVGAGKTLEVARKLFKIELKGKLIGVLNFAENEFCAATKTTYGANPIHLINNHNDIKAAKKEVDFLLVIAHGGREHYQLPTPNQRERYRFYAESGADLVVGHHAHCYGGYETHNDVPIFYNLGNFIFDYKKKYQTGMWTEGYGVQFTLLDDTISFELVPFFQGRLETPTLKLMNEDEKKGFFSKIEELNNSITTDALFENHWEDYLKTQSILYKSSLLIQNKYIRALMIKGLIPGIFLQSKSYKSLLLNLMRCETHKEIMSTILEKDI